MPLHFPNNESAFLPHTACFARLGPFKDIQRKLAVKSAAPVLLPEKMLSSIYAEEEELKKILAGGGKEEEEERGKLKDQPSISARLFTKNLSLVSFRGFLFANLLSAFLTSKPSR